MLESTKPVKEKVNFLCKIGLHSYKDRVLYDYINASEESVPCILREECVRCGKIRNELKGAWEQKKGKYDGN